MKISLQDAGHMIMMAAMPIHGKTLQTFFSQEPVDRFPRKLIDSIWDSSPL